MTWCLLRTIWGPGLGLVSLRDSSASRQSWRRRLGMFNMAHGAKSQSPSTASECRLACSVLCPEWRWTKQMTMVRKHWRSLRCERGLLWRHSTTKSSNSAWGSSLGLVGVDGGDESTRSRPTDRLGGESGAAGDLCAASCLLRLGGIT